VLQRWGKNWCVSHAVFIKIVHLSRQLLLPKTVWSLTTAKLSAFVEHIFLNLSQSIFGFHFAVFTQFLYLSLPMEFSTRPGKHCNTCLPFLFFKIAPNQITRFLDSNGGPGIQHIGLSVSNIFDAVRVGRAGGAQFLDPPKTYYDEVGFCSSDECIVFPKRELPGHGISQFFSLFVLFPKIALTF
ncbi:unnamed protein product, partial [Echinostoma caproni]|uniref:VOC domain-containing protein n=1 Tax=Echinostoma caproni TaxID=27848 RepID=A0A183A4N8_9TREM